MSSLIAREKEIERVFTDLQIYSKDKSAINVHFLKTELTDLITSWDRLLGKTGAIIKASDPLLLNLSVAANAQILYYILAPLEYYMMALEEIVNPAFRDAATRCGMFCERVVNILLAVLKQDDIKDSKFENKIGRLQSVLTDRDFTPAQLLCSSMRNIYNLRDTRGPHDVPAADEIDAKFCVSSCPLVYSRYSQALEHMSQNVGQYMPDFVKLVNSILDVSGRLAIGPGGRSLSAKDSIEVILFRNGFFSSERTFEEIRQKLGESGYTFPDGTLGNTLRRLTAPGGFLTRKNISKGFVYVQRIPPQEYYLLKPRIETV